MAYLQEPALARVMVVGKDPLILRALSRLLELDEGIAVIGESPSVGTAPIAELRPEIVILDQSDQAVDAAQAEQYVAEVSPGTRVCLLEALGDLNLRDLLGAVKMLVPSFPGAARPRLRVLATGGTEALSGLSEREMEVVRLVAEGLSNKEISTRLSLSDKTVKNHISHILAKMNLTARTQVAVYALRAGLVSAHQVFPRVQQQDARCRAGAGRLCEHDRAA